MQASVVTTVPPSDLAKLRERVAATGNPASDAAPLRSR
jgi:hypothetical protein